MYVCLCNGVTSKTVQEAVDAGAHSTRDVARACGAGEICGRCKQTIRAMIAARAGNSHHRPLLRRWGKAPQ